MDVKKAAGATRRVAGFVAFGGALWSMKMSASLLRKEFARTKENGKVLGEMAREVKGRFKGTDAREVTETESFETAAKAAAAKGVSVVDVYMHFLGRKRLALALGGVFISIGAAGVLQHVWMGLLPMIVGTMFCLEMAWLAEFRLWQVRTRRISKAEQAGVGDFWRTPGAWRGAFHIEWGVHVAPEMRPFRGWLVVKRCALTIALAGLLLGIFHRSTVAAYALTSAIALLVAMLVELRLCSIRRALRIRAPRLAALRFEVGAGYEKGQA
jgi:hypothetical protein